MTILTTTNFIRNFAGCRHREVKLPILPFLIFFSIGPVPGRNLGLRIYYTHICCSGIDQLSPTTVLTPAKGNTLCVYNVQITSLSLSIKFIYVYLTSISISCRIMKKFYIKYQLIEHGKFFCLKQSNVNVVYNIYITRRTAYNRTDIDDFYSSIKHLSIEVESVKCVNTTQQI